MNEDTNQLADIARAVVASQPEAVPVAVAPEVMMDNRALLNQVGEDMSNAELGDFCRLRAGVGLLRFRELNAHGQWMAEMTAAFPNRTPRTLQRYMQQASKFCASVGVDADTVHSKMMTFNVDALRAQIGLSAEERQALPERGVSKSVAIENKIKNAVVAYSAGQKPEFPKEKSVRITKEEEMQTRIDFANSLALKIRDWVEETKIVRTLPTETLESVRAMLVLVTDVLKNELRSREG